MKKFDIFPKFSGDYSRKSTFSGIVSLICVVLIAIFLIYDFYLFIKTPYKQKIYVDDTRLPEKNKILDWSRIPTIPITANIRFPKLSCQFLTVNVYDHNKDIQQEAKIDTYYTSNPSAMEKFVNASEIKTTECGSCYGASNGCCNSCKEVLNAFKKIEKSHPPISMIEQCRNTFSDADSLKNDSCMASIALTVPHTHGSFFITIGQNITNTSADYLGVPKDELNFTHIFDYFYMGKPHYSTVILQKYKRVQQEYGRYKAMYYIRATRIIDDYDTRYSLSVTSYDRYRDESSDKLPGIFINYDISPLVLQYVLDRPIYQMIIDMMAIIGGIFAVGILIDHIYLASTYQTNQIV